MADAAHADNKESASASIARLSEDKKVTVKLRAVGGDTPILKRKKFKVKGSHQFSHIVVFLRKSLKIKQTDSLFLYCGQAFSPSPEEIIGDLFNVCKKFHFHI
eukprot:jgi/Bigna1/54138/estExt_Genewise1Plus.C_290024